ncbi:hypothetical protein MSMEI_1647 [Mycolicibacterium smegmatis MC2 155]|uniref:Uncharacterized protein n=1 Tax=Mycolicibacterium smegmatis (strain ATCC 700084 / mc(2)155) TaxID=246196 RepID=I7G665_MYCS2|nr:hypothetical protein MSMEI_1647 [Mycolicibacterium smegmatis MC2 155]
MNQCARHTDLQERCGVVSGGVVGRGVALRRHTGLNDLIAQRGNSFRLSIQGVEEDGRKPVGGRAEAGQM